MRDRTTQLEKNELMSQSRTEEKKKDAKGRHHLQKIVMDNAAQRSAGLWNSRGGPKGGIKKALKKKTERQKKRDDSEGHRDIVKVEGNRQKAGKKRKGDDKIIEKPYGRRNEEKDYA